MSSSPFNFKFNPDAEEDVLLLWLPNSGATSAQSLVVVDCFLEEVLEDFSRTIQEREGKIRDK